MSSLYIVCVDPGLITAKGLKKCFKGLPMCSFSLRDSFETDEETMMGEWAGLVGLLGIGPNWRCCCCRNDVMTRVNLKEDVCTNEW